MNYDQCTELEAIDDFATFEGRSMRRYTKGQRVWVCNSRDSQERLQTIALARKGKNAATAQYWTAADCAQHFQPVT